jgi:hypothetical protein
MLSLSHPPVSVSLHAQHESWSAQLTVCLTTQYETRIWSGILERHLA